jgi:hypothetical protein
MQFGALWAMLLIGIPGACAAFEPAGGSKRVRIGGVAWVALWWLPPMTMLWIKGVFG